MNQKSFEDERHHEMFKIMPPYFLDLGAPIILIGCSVVYSLNQSSAIV
jgi:hypothetical protein